MVTDQKAQADAYMERLRESDRHAAGIMWGIGIVCVWILFATIGTLEAAPDRHANFDGVFTISDAITSFSLGFTSLANWAIFEQFGPDIWQFFEQPTAPIWVTVPVAIVLWGFLAWVIGEGVYLVTRAIRRGYVATQERLPGQLLMGDVIVGGIIALVVVGFAFAFISSRKAG